MPGVIVAAAGYAAAGAAASAVGFTAGAATVIGFGITVGTAGAFVASALYSSYEQQNQRKAAEEAARNARQTLTSNLQDRRLVLRGSVQSRRFILGTHRVGGALVYATSSGSQRQFLHLVIALAGHECAGIPEVYINDQPVGAVDGNGFPTGGAFVRTVTDRSVPEQFVVPGGGGTFVASATVSQVSSVTYRSADAEGNAIDVLLNEGVDYTRSGSTFTFPAALAGQRIYINYRARDVRALVRVRRYLGTQTTADADLVAETGGEWTTAHVGRGVTYLYLRLEYDEVLFANGQPKIEALVNGLPAFDARNSTTAHTRNPALLARAYAVHPLGGALPASVWPASLDIATANVCDETVTNGVSNGAGGFADGPRYRCDTVLDTAASRIDNLAQILSAMVGAYAYVDGQVRTRAGAYTAPVLDLTDDDLADGDIETTPRAARDDLFNQVAGTYVNANDVYRQATFPLVKSAAALAADRGKPLTRTITLAATTDPVMAQRIAKVQLLEHRQALVHSATFKHKALELVPGDIVTRTSARYGWAAKPFRVVTRAAALNGTQLTLREVSATSYDWAFTEAVGVDASPNTNLTVGPPAAPVLDGQPQSGTAQLLQLGDGTVQVRVLVAWLASADRSVLALGQTELEWKTATGTDADWQVVGPLRGDDTRAWVLNPPEAQVINIRVRFRNGLNQPSPWTYATHLVVGKDQPPGDVPFLLTAGTLATWGAVAGADIAGYLLRSWAQPGTPNWAQANALHEGVLTATTLDLAGRLQGVTSLLVKAVDTSGNESLQARVASVNASSALAGNTFATWPQAPGFAGTIVDGTVNTGVLQADDAADAFWGTDDAPFWRDDTAAFWPASTWRALQYTFEVQPTQAGLLAIDLAVTGTYTLQYRLGSQAAFWGPDANAFWGADADAFWQGTSSPWLDWPGLLAVRAAEPVQLRITFNAGATRGSVTTLTPFLDVPTLVHEFQQFDVGAGGARIPLPTGWAQVRGVVATVVTTGSGAVTCTQEDFSTTPGPLVQTRNASGTAVAGRINGRVVGF